MKRIYIYLLLLCSWVGYGQDINKNNQEFKGTLNTSQSCCTKECSCEATQTPAGVMTDHIHDKGKWMISYTYMNMTMQGNQMGTTRVSENTVYQNYTMSPETMNMQMHMVMAMFGITDKLTLMAMGGISYNYMTMNMSNTAMSMPGMVMNMGSMTMASESSGITDTKLTALYKILDKSKSGLIGSCGISLPTGTIQATGTTMLGDNQRLPYGMQIGTGSFGITPGITYTLKSNLFTAGIELGGDIKLNNNSLGYKLGNVYHATVWASYKLLSFVSCSIRTEAISVDKIHGSDKVMNLSVYQTDDPTAKTSNYGGTWCNLYAGLNFHLSNQTFSKFSLLTEYGIPVYQNLNGTQMSLHNNALATIQYAL